MHGPEGVEAHEDGVRLLELLRREGVVDAVALKIGDYAEWGEDAGVSRFRKSGWMTPFIKQGKSILGPSIPVVGNGRLTNPDDMVALIRGGVLDIIGAARPSIADPFLPTKISEGRLEDIRECIGCNICVSKFQQGRPDHVHPERHHRRGVPARLASGEIPQGQEPLQRADRRRRVLRAWSARGYWASAAIRVHLREAERELGGHWKSIATLPRLAEWARVITYRQIQLRKLKKNVAVHTRRRPDEHRRGAALRRRPSRRRHGLSLVRATAAARTSVRSRAPTTSLPHVLTPTQIMQGKQVPGKRGTHP